MVPELPWPMGLMGIEFNLSPEVWIVDIWNCQGTLKPLRLAGFGTTFDLPPGWTWVRAGRFLVPVREGPLPSSEALVQAEGILLDEIELAGGGLNISGWYRLSEEAMERLDVLLGMEFRRLTCLLLLVEAAQARNPLPHG